MRIFFWVVSTDVAIVSVSVYRNHADAARDYGSYATYPPQSKALYMVDLRTNQVTELDSQKEG